MRDSIIVSISDLRTLVQDARRTGKTYVQVNIADSFEEDGEIYPAELSLCTCDPSECIDFEPIYAPENESELAAAMDGAVHMSSNLL